MVTSKRHDWIQIKKDFLNSKHNQITPFLMDVYNFTLSQVKSGQTARKLGSFKDLEKQKALKQSISMTTKLVQDPLKYAPREIILNTPGQLKASANLAKNSLYKTLMKAVMNIEGKLEAGEMDDMDIIKNAKGFETLVNMFEAIEAGAESLQAYGAGGGSSNGNGNGLNNQPQLIIQVIDNNRKQVKPANIIDVGNK